MSKLKVYELEPLLSKIIIDSNATYTDAGNEPKEILLGFLESNIEAEIEQLKHENLVEESIVDEEETDWLGENKRLGDWGEQIALNCLRSVYSIEKVSHVAARAYLGYDIEVVKEETIYGFEVKTAKDHLGFHLSLNELKVASDKLDNYNIFFIKIDIFTNKLFGYIINNPVELFELDVPAIMKSVELSHVTIMPNKFYFQMKPSLFSELTEIDLISYVDKESKSYLAEILNKYKS